MVSIEDERGTKPARAYAIVTILIYTALSFLFFARELIASFRCDYIGTGTDPTESMWFLRWWPYVIHEAANPFFTRLIWAPEGTNLTWAMSVPLPAFAAVPITHFFGPIAAYNVLCIAAPVFSALAAFLLCRYVTESYWPSLLGGFIFGFSPYVLGQLLAHLNLAMAFPVPIAGLAVAMKYRRDLSNGAYVAMLSTALIAAFLCFPELYATMTVFGGIALVLACVVLPDRESLNELVIPTAAAFGVSVLVVSPYIYEMLTSSPPDAPLYPPAKFSADLLNFVVPTQTALVGTLPPLIAISRKFSGDIYEQGACLGIPLILIVEDWRRRHWRDPESRFAVLMLLAVCVAALGPVLMVAGKPTFPMPWAIFGHVPLLEVALPARFMAYAFLLAAVIAASWFAFSPARRGFKLLAAAAVVIFMLPNLSGNFWVSPAQLPSFFADGIWRDYLEPSEIILALPYERMGSSMLWQAQANMSFRMAEGYTTRKPFAFARLPIVSFFSGSIDLPEAPDHLKAFIASKRVSTIVADPADPNFAIWQSVLDALGLMPINVGGVVLYQVPTGKFADYAALSPRRLEQRALARRLDMLIEAGAEYLALGNRIDDLTPLALKRAGLLPSSWAILNDPAALQDYMVLSIHGRVGIAIGGSYEALRPLAQRYHNLATRIDFPYPRQWSPTRKYPARSIAQPMVFEFTPGELMNAAKALKASPPPERTTPFLEYTARGAGLSASAIPGGARR
jgi:hypothetical protein